MVDPTSDLGTDVDEADAPECATCGAKIVQSPTHRVVTWIEDDRVAHRHFCSDECKADHGARAHDSSTEDQNRSTP